MQFSRPESSLLLLLHQDLVTMDLSTVGTVLYIVLTFTRLDGLMPSINVIVNLAAYCIFVWCFNPYFLRHMLPNCTLLGLQWSILSYEHEQLLSTRLLSTIPQASVWQQTHVAGVAPSDSLVEFFCSQKKPSKQNNFWKSISWQCEKGLRAWLQCYGFELICSIFSYACFSSYNTSIWKY